jgi:hypothetical protein
MKAKAANPDYTGEQLRSDLSAASSAKYGLSKDYMENVFPVLASHVSGFGNKLSTGLSALVGGRMTKTVKAELEKEGLLKGGRLLDESGYISNNYEWTDKHIRPLLEKKLGVHFGEEMSEGDKGKVLDWLQHHFSARNAADLMATNLLDRPLVERARSRKTMNLEGMDDLQHKDAGLAWQGLTEQAKDAGAALMGLNASVKAMDWVADAFSRLANTARTGKFPEGSPGEKLQRIMAPVSDDDYAERERRNNLLQQTEEWQNRLVGTDGDQSSSTKTMRMNIFEAQQAYYASKMFSEQGPIFTDEEVQRMRDAHVPLPTAGPRRGPDGIPIDASRPEATSTAMPPVQSLEGAPQRVDVQGEVNGEVQQTIQLSLQPSKWWDALEQKVENLVKMVGSIKSNGPGSTGKSSPDAAAPATGFNGAGAAPY